MKLPRLEGIQAYKHPGRFEQGALSHPVGAPLRVIGGSDYYGMFHALTFRKAAADNVIRIVSANGWAGEHVQLGSSFEATCGPRPSAEPHETTQGPRYRRRRDAEYPLRSPSVGARPYTSARRAGAGA